MRRRDFIAGLSAAAVVAPPLLAHAQTESVRRIGLLMGGTPENDPETVKAIAAFQQALQRLGWSEGKNIKTGLAWGAADPERVRVAATTLIAQRPDVLLPSGTLALAALAKQTRDIPIVFTTVNDPVGAGFVTSYAHPGGNITGFTAGDPQIAGKLLELLREIAPRLTRAAAIFEADLPVSIEASKVAASAARASGVDLVLAPAHTPAEIEHTVEGFAASGGGGLIVIPAPLTVGSRERIIALADRHKLPAAYPYSFFARGGGLMSYGPSRDEMFRSAAAYVDRILHGTKPADLPIQDPTTFQLVINLKTAKALGLSVPFQLQQRADEVIE